MRGLPLSPVTSESSKLKSASSSKSPPSKFWVRFPITGRPGWIDFGLGVNGSPESGFGTGFVPAKKLFRSLTSRFGFGVVVIGLEVSFLEVISEVVFANGLVPSLMPVWQSSSRTWKISSKLSLLSRSGGTSMLCLTKSS